MRRQNVPAINTAAIGIAALFCCFHIILNNVAHAGAEAQSDWSAGVAWGQGASRWVLERGVRKLRPDTYRLTITKHDLTTILTSDRLAVTVDLDTSIYHWDDPFRNRAITMFTLVPMLRVQTQWQRLTPFIGIGIGVAVLDSKDWMDRELGSHIMFEDKPELGFRYRYHQLTVGISHFSNADLASINHGANIYQLGYQYRW
jgi:hypothetical protein